MLLNKKEKLLLVVLFLVSIAFFTRYDLIFTKLIYQPNSEFGKFFWMFGEQPGLFAGLTCLALLTTRYTGIDDKKRDYNRLFYGLLTFIMGFIISIQLIKYLELPFFPFIFIGFILSMILIVWANQLSDSKKKLIRVYAFIGVLTVILGILIPNAIKLVWARPRYRIMIGNDSLFRYWFDRVGFTFDDDWKSFPSGHSAAATTTLIYTFLPQLFDKLKGKERSILIICSVWIVIVMVSRIVMGDHFMTDTLFGTGSAILVFSGLKYLFLKNNIIKGKVGN
jgi:membrane-associated phospholipid phosphatase